MKHFEDAPVMLIPVNDALLTKEILIIILFFKKYIVFLHTPKYGVLHYVSVYQLKT